MTVNAKPAANPFAQVAFLKSCAKLAQCPDDGIAELAFAGRSNAGKSSALNRICGRKALARVSKTPGRTQLINLFDVPDMGRLVDLPGYGYAKVPQNIRLEWARMVGQYVERRETLTGIVLIMDCRHPLTEFDQQMLHWVRAGQRNCHVLLTKADKLKFGAAKNTLLKTRAEIERMGLPIGIQLFSAVSGQGLDEARGAIAALLESAAPEPPMPESGP